ncbi:Major Facilitator Family (MFS) transporter [Fulvimarina pelagi HTCC2506]|uniref:Major Facilitator Family (MFS) transporter n=2 Tax=Fulvimarina pelagi TaxID=217511 RepID=Q0FZM9_9HYPH|nr:YbfB/YjiJ family MFS transporter [Fulvimarina pelagi]EAU40562.1 Major Facilitator Family (MFS) transporter [Fulvimarina pelagi HTCC2506]BAT31585.1 major facilitator family transporter [Fulvimarina pelagi]
MRKLARGEEAEPLPPWLQVIGLAAAAAVGLGLARFAYALILPDMRADLGWSYSTAGWLNTTNALGYLAGALLAARVNRKVGAFSAMQIGVWLCVGSLAFCIVLRDPITLNLARILAGIGAGFAFVGGGFLAARIASQNEGNAILLGLFYAGPGFGIALSGVTVPFVFHAGGAGSWPLAWALLAVLSAILGVILLLGQPHCMGTAPSGTGTKARIGKMSPILIGYGFFGAGYIGYLTFVIAWVRENGASLPLQSGLWTVVGLGAMVSPWLWGGFMKRNGNGTAFAILSLLLAAATSLVALSQSPIVLFVSATMVGATFLAVVASTTAFVRRNFAAEHWSAGISAMTIAFGIGQILGPVGVGFLSDVTGGVSAGQWISTGLLIAGAGIASSQRDFGQTAYSS